MKNFKLLFLLSTFLITILSTSIFVFADETNEEKTKLEIIESNQKELEKNVKIGENGVEFENVPNIDQLSSKFEKKGYEVVNFLKRVSQPFAIIMLIFGFLITVIGTAMGSKLKSVGISVIVTVVIMYVGVLFSDSILDFFVLWIND